MKTHLGILFTIVTFFSHADFLDATKNYKEGRFKQAYDEMIVLAKFGHQLSQQNVAVMLFKGEGVQKDPIQAYAWSQLLTDEKTASQLSEAIAQSLSDEELEVAKKTTLEYKEKYAFENSKVLLGPITTSDDSNNNDNDNTIAKIDYDKSKLVAPDYPRNLAISGVQGWVDLTFNVFPDGSVRNIQVTKETPGNSFAVAAIKSIEQYSFKFKKNGVETTITEPITSTQRIQFKLGKEPYDFNPKQTAYIKKLITHAKKGDVNAQFTYASIYDTYLDKKGEINAETVNDWLFNAAQNGIHDAQYRLGKNIYYGEDCKVEKQKGMDWIMRAAQEGNANAEFMAYQLLKNKKVINQSSQTPFYWLKQAATNGLAVAQLNYAKEIALLENPTDEQKILATDYLKSYARKMHKTVQWLHIDAMLRLKTDKKPKKALASINKAIKKAKAIGWDVSELNTQKQLILASKS